ncbi:Crp/Fnr family transcriptional regulator [Candidatus Riflebacteria bacterium]
MDKTKEVKLLKGITECGLFTGLSASVQESLIHIVQLRVFKAKEILFLQGDQARGFYIILKGEVKVSRFNAEGREQVLHILGSGETCGEVPVFQGSNYPATTHAVGKTEVLYFSRKRFLELGKEQPELLLGMLAVLSMRLRHFVNLVEDLSLKEVSARLAKHLLALSKKQENTLKIELKSSKTTLASRLGTVAETLSRTLARMQKKAIIRVHGKKITILNIERLQGLDSGEKL